MFINESIDGAYVGYNPAFVRKVREKRKAEEIARAKAERERRKEEERKAAAERKKRIEQAQLVYRVIHVREPGSVPPPVSHAPELHEMPDRPVRPLARDIMAEIAEAHGMRVADITGASRHRPIVAARFAAIRAVADARPDLSLVQIGRMFNRDHTSILSALRKTKQPGQAR